MSPGAGMAHIPASGAWTPLDRWSSGHGQSKARYRGQSVGRARTSRLGTATWGPRERDAQVDSGHEAEWPSAGTGAAAPSHLRLVSQTRTLPPVCLEDEALVKVSGSQGVICAPRAVHESSLRGGPDSGRWQGPCLQPLSLAVCPTASWVGASGPFAVFPLLAGQIRSRGCPFLGELPLCCGGR